MFIKYNNKIPSQENSRSNSLKLSRWDQQKMRIHEIVAFGQQKLAEIPKPFSLCLHQQDPIQKFHEVCQDLNCNDIFVYLKEIPSEFLAYFIATPSASWIVPCRQTFAHFEAFWFWFSSLMKQSNISTDPSPMKIMYNLWLFFIHCCFNLTGLIMSRRPVHEVSSKEPKGVPCWCLRSKLINFVMYVCCNSNGLYSAQRQIIW